MEESPDKVQGVPASSERLLKTILAVAQNRLELWLLELQEERCRLFQAALPLAAVVVFGGMTLVVATLIVVVLFWEDHRVTGLAGFSLLYFQEASYSYRWEARRALEFARSAPGPTATPSRDRRREIGG